MKNVLKYYYNIDVQNIVKSKDEYKFYKNGIAYSLIMSNRTDEEIKQLFELSNQLNSLNILCHSIILNNSGKILTNINNKNYILLRKYVSSNDLITINDIIAFSTITSYRWNYQSLLRTNWKALWAQKIDYFEYQLSQVGRRYKNIYRSFGYYAGLVENGIQLFDLFGNFDGATICVSHKRLSYNTTLDEFYNPLNFIIDYKVRDITEYLKQKLILDGTDFSEVDYCIKNYFLSYDDKKLFMTRILFPSFYFDMYEKIMDGTINDEKLISILTNNEKYEKFIKKTYAILKTYVNLPNIEWLNP